MPSNVTVGLLVDLWNKLIAIAKEEQRTRSGWRMVKGTGQGVLAAFHLPVGESAQHLDPWQAERRRCYFDCQNGFKHHFAAVSRLDVQIPPTSAPVHDFLFFLNYARTALRLYSQ